MSLCAKIEIFICFVIHVSPRFIKFTPLATGQLVYRIECTHVNFVSRTNDFPLFSQNACMCAFWERDYPADYMSKCFIDIADRIHQRSALELNVRESLKNRKYSNLQDDICTYYTVVTMDTVISVRCTLASYYV